MVGLVIIYSDDRASENQEGRSCVDDYLCRGVYN